MATAAKPATGGAIYIAPAGTAVPTSTTGALTSFVSLGAISEDGTVRKCDRESVDVIDWNGDTQTTLNVSMTESYTFAMLDTTDANVLKVVYGDDNVTTTNGEVKVKANAKALEEHAFVIDMLLSDGKAERICIARGKVSEVGDISYVSDEAIKFEVTIKCLVDANGDQSVTYIK